MSRGSNIDLEIVHPLTLVSTSVHSSSRLVSVELMVSSCGRDFGRFTWCTLEERECVGPMMWGKQNRVVLLSWLVRYLSTTFALLPGWSSWSWCLWFGVSEYFHIGKLYRGTTTTCVHNLTLGEREGGREGGRGRKGGGRGEGGRKGKEGRGIERARMKEEEINYILCN